jgi:hypothetical protein
MNLTHRLLARHAWVEVSILLDVFSNHLSPSITKPNSQQGTDLVNALLQQPRLILALRHGGKCDESEKIKSTGPAKRRHMLAWHDSKKGQSALP